MGLTRLQDLTGLGHLLESRTSSSRMKALQNHRITPSLRAVLLVRRITADCCGTRSARVEARSEASATGPIGSRAASTDRDSYTDPDSPAADNTPSASRPGYRGSRRPGSPSQPCLCLQSRYSKSPAKVHWGTTQVQPDLRFRLDALEAANYRSNVLEAAIPIPVADREATHDIAVVKCRPQNEPRGVVRLDRRIAPSLISWIRYV